MCHHIRMQTHCGQPASGALDVTHLGQLDIQRNIPQPINPKSRKRDQILISLSRRKRYSQHCRPTCFTMTLPPNQIWIRTRDNDKGGIGTAETSLLRIVSCQNDAFCSIFYAVSGDRWVMGYLLHHQGGLASTSFVGWPIAVEDSKIAISSILGRGRQRNSLTLQTRDSRACTRLG